MCVWHTICAFYLFYREEDPGLQGQASDPTSTVHRNPNRFSRPAGVRHSPAARCVLEIEKNKSEFVIAATTDDVSADTLPTHTAHYIHVGFDTYDLLHKWETILMLF